MVLNIVLIINVFQNVCELNNKGLHVLKQNSIKICTKLN